MTLYQLLRYRNDAKAIMKGRAPQRLVRRFIYGRAFRAASFVSRLLKVNR